MSSTKLPRVLRDADGRLPGDPLRGARLREMLHPMVSALWKKAHTHDFTDEEIEKAISELVDEEAVRRLAKEFTHSNEGSFLPGKAAHKNSNNAYGRPKDPNRS